MKVCPNCDQTYTDDTLSYCLNDGTQLISGESQPTVIIEHSGPTAPITTAAKRNNTALWISLIIVILIFAIVVLVAAMMFFYNRNPATGTTNRPASANTLPSPKSAAPKSSPSATPGMSPTPATDLEKMDGKTDDPDEVTPILWSTSGSSFQNDVGKSYKFECPGNGVAEAVWGSDIYTTDSSICTAAVHAGVITLESGGPVTIEFRPGRTTYGSTVRNGITSSTYGNFPNSFVVR